MQRVHTMTVRFAMMDAFRFVIFRAAILALIWASRLSRTNSAGYSMRAHQHTNAHGRANSLAAVTLRSATASAVSICHAHEGVTHARLDFEVPLQRRCGSGPGWCQGDTVAVCSTCCRRRQSRQVPLGTSLLLGSTTGSRVCRRKRCGITAVDHDRERAINLASRQNQPRTSC